MSAVVSGRVQGVGFRAWARTRARAHGLVGAAHNLPDGRVEVVAEGSRRSCAAMADELADGPGRVDDVTVRWAEPHGDAAAFTIG